MILKITCIQNQIFITRIKHYFRHAENLLQLDNGIKIPPKGWKCEKCDLTSNLWLNLTDGSILCGRRFFDGSGGNNHAVEHYDQVKYPLAVKLGTITGEGAGILITDHSTFFFVFGTIFT